MKRYVILLYIAFTVIHKEVWETRVYNVVCRGIMGKSMEDLITHENSMIIKGLIIRVKQNLFILLTPDMRKLIVANML